MKLNIANPLTNQQKVLEVEDERKLIPFFDKRMGAEVKGDSLGSEWAGYIFKITGGNDKQGFPMMQGVLTNGRVRLLFKKGMKTFRERRAGSFKRKSVRGCIVGADLSVLSLAIVQKGAEVPGLTDENVPKRLGPKRVNKIRALFGLSKEDDVRPFVVRRELGDKHKAQYKRPALQRLITPARLQRKRRERVLKARKIEKKNESKAEYERLVASWKATQKKRISTSA